MITKRKKQRVIKESQKHEKDTGHALWSEEQIIEAELNSDPLEDRGD